MSARILIIEDNHDNLELMKYLLEQFGYVVLTAMDGEAGLAVVKREIPHLIICDIQLPKLNGYEIAAQLKSDTNLSKIPLIAVTAYSMVGDKNKIVSAGFNGYIPKPIDPENFVKQIEEFLTSEQRSVLLPKTNNVSQELKIAKNDSMPAKGIILVVDDISENSDLLKTILESLGFDFISANSVENAIEVLNTIKPDLILSDLHMPNIDGLEFLKIVKANSQLKSIPFIIISSTAPSALQLKYCIEHGAIKIILRPIDPQLLVQAINEIWLSSIGSQAFKSE